MTADTLRAIAAFRRSVKLKQSSDLVTQGWELAEYLIPVPPPGVLDNRSAKDWIAGMVKHCQTSTWFANRLKSKMPSGVEAVRVSTRSGVETCILGSQSGWFPHRHLDNALSVAIEDRL